MTEIERKFLVDFDSWKNIEKPVPELIVQGYIFNSLEKTLRIRIKNGKGYLTLKGKTKGISRSEFEFEIPLKEAESILEIFTEKAIVKDRYTIIYEGHTWEVDVFHGKLDGLILAEIELKAEDEKFTKPRWVTTEVSENPNYFNAKLIDRC
jgi:CYTH domain-containing protein